MWKLLGQIILQVGASYLNKKLNKRPPPRPLPPAPPKLTHAQRKAAKSPPPAQQVVKVVQTKSSVDYVALRNNAIAAGFNPLTALRNGGAAGFQITNTPFLTVNPAYTRWADATRRSALLLDYNRSLSEIRYQNDLSRYNFKQERRSAWISGLTSAAGAFLKYNPYAQAMADKKRNLELQLLESEIGRNNRTNRKTLTVNQAYATGRSGNSVVSSQPNPDGWKSGDVTVTNPHYSWDIDPNTSDVQSFEQRYGESSFLNPTWFQSWNVLARDTYVNSPALQRVYKNASHELYNIKRRWNGLQSFPVESRFNLN